MQSLPEQPRRRSACSGRSAGALVGIWEGTVAAPAGIELQMVVKVSKTEEAGVRGTLDVPDQSAVGIPLDSVAIEGDAVTFAIKSIGAEYQGTRDVAGT